MHARVGEINRRPVAPRVKPAAGRTWRNIVHGGASTRGARDRRVLRAPGEGMAAVSLSLSRPTEAMSWYSTAWRVGRITYGDRRGDTRRRMSRPSKLVGMGYVGCARYARAGRR